MGRYTNFFNHQQKLSSYFLGIVSALNLKIHPDSQKISYCTEEEDDSGIHVAYYDVKERNLTNLGLIKKWSSDDYLKYADGRSVKGERHCKSHYYASLEIENGAIKNSRRSHFSYLGSDKPYTRPQNKPEFQRQPDLELKASGESHLNLLRCDNTRRTREKRSSIHFPLQNLKHDSLSYGGMQHLKWSSAGLSSKPSRTFYELLRCYSDPSVKQSELSQCVKELHHLAKIDDEIFNNIVNLTLERSHLNFSTWSGLVGSLVVRGDYQTQKILSQMILSEEPRPLSDEEHAKLLEAVYFIPAGPLHPELLEALLSLHKNPSKNDEITVRAMLVMSALVRQFHDAGYNRSLSENIAKHLHQSFKTHPARFHEEESQSRDEYIWSHICAFGNLGHISSLNFITRYLDHDSSSIRYFAVSALRKLPKQYTDHHLLRVLRDDEHITVKAGVIEVFIERRQNLTEKLRDAIEDVLWVSVEGDELDSKITEFLENHNEMSYRLMKNLRKRRATIRRKKRALIPALKPREFSLGIRKNWQRAFGGSKAGAEAIMRFVNEVKLRIGIFGGRFEVNLDNLALFRAHVIMWSFDVVNGRAAFRMEAGFKNDIPKDIIHTVADAADDILAKVDDISSIFTQHIQRFLDKLKTYLPFIPNDFFDFIKETDKFLSRTTEVTRSGRNFNGILLHLRSALRASKLWLKIRDLVKKLSLCLSKVKLSTVPFEKGFHFLDQFEDLFSRFELPRNFPPNFNIQELLVHINGPFHSTGDAVESYFKKLGFTSPKNFFVMLHFNVTLNFIVSLDEFKIATLRLVHFGNNFLEMLSVFRDMFDIDIPLLHLPECNIDVYSNRDFGFGLPFDWRVKFKFEIDFSGSDFVQFRNIFRHLTTVFLDLGNPNINFEQLFTQILPNVKTKLESEKLIANADDSNMAKWLQLVTKEFHNRLSQLDWKLLDLSNSAGFLDKVSNVVADFSEKELGNVCKLQSFMLKSKEIFERFGENLERDMIRGIRNVKNKAHQTVREVTQISFFVDDFIDELKDNLSSSAKIFVDQYLTELESSLKNVKQFADVTMEFSAKSTDKLTGLCYETVNISGDILDKIQSEAQNAVKEIANFFTSKSKGVNTSIGQFKVVVKKLEKWYQQNFKKHLGKIPIVSKTVEEFLSLIKGEDKGFSDIHNVFKIINNVIQLLDNLPTHAQKAYDFADTIRDFATNGKLWESEFMKLNIRQRFKLDFDEQLRKLCDKLHSFDQETIKQIYNDYLFKTFREFVMKETDFLISQSVDKLNLLKIPLQDAQSDLKEMSNSVSEIEAVLVELRPFSDSFSPVLLGIRTLPNCSNIYLTFNKIITECGKETISFGKKAYNEYIIMKSEVKAFLELLPDEWESLSSQRCISGGTCLSNSFKKQAQEVSNKMEKLKYRFNDFNFVNKLKTCKDSVDDASRIFQSIKNISKLVLEFSLKEEVTKITDLSRRITGKYFGDEDRLNPVRYHFQLLKRVLEIIIIHFRTNKDQLQANVHYN